MEASEGDSDASARYAGVKRLDTLTRLAYTSVYIYMICVYIYVNMYKYIDTCVNIPR